MWWKNEVVAWADRLASQPRQPPPQAHNFEKGHQRKAAAAARHD
jgi:hypothetical protein